MTKDRILHVGPQPPPYGGVAVMMEWTMGTPLLSEHAHIPFDLSRGRYWEFVGTKPFSLERILRRGVLAVGLAWRAARIRPSLVHFHCGSGGRWDFLGDMLLLAAARLGGSPLLFHWHRDTRSSYYPGRTDLSRGVFRRSAGTAEALAVLLEDYRAPLSQIGLGHKVHVIPNTFHSQLLNLPIPRPRRKRVQVAYLGRLAQEKGFPDLVQVAKFLSTRTQRPEVIFTVAGASDPGQGGLAGARTTLDRMGIANRVTLLGPVEGEAKIRFFGDADILLLPSYRESFGIVALEAMAAGLPVATYDVGHLRDIIGDGGIFSPVGDVEGLAAAISELAGDPGLRRRMGANGRARAVSQFGPEVVGARIRELYEALLGSAGGGP